MPSLFSGRPIQWSVDIACLQREWEVCLAVKWQCFECKCWEQVWELLSVSATVKQKRWLRRSLDSQMLLAILYCPLSDINLSGSEEGALPPSCGQLLNTSMVILPYTHTVAVVSMFKLCISACLQSPIYMCHVLEHAMLHLHWAAVFWYCIHHVFGLWVSLTEHLHTVYCSIRKIGMLGCYFGYTWLCSTFMWSC